MRRWYSKLERAVLRGSLIVTSRDALWQRELSLPNAVVRNAERVTSYLTSLRSGYFDAEKKPFYQEEACLH